MSLVCQNCYKYKIFKDKCWYYWELKKECSKFVEDENSPEGYNSVKN